MEPPFELDDIPEWTVLQDMTYTWGHQTLFVRCSNAAGGFENEVFARNPDRWFGSDGEGPAQFVYKPDGLEMSINSMWTVEEVNHPVSRRRLRAILRECVDSARDTVRGLGL